MLLGKKGLLLAILSVQLFSVYAEDLSKKFILSEIERIEGLYPEIPAGILYAVSYTNTHFNHLENEQESCLFLPEASGVMGLLNDPSGYFRSNLTLVSELSGYSIESIKRSPSISIEAYAIALKKVLKESNYQSISDLRFALEYLSEIPQDVNKVNTYALQSFVYSCFKFLMNPINQEKYTFPDYKIHLEEVFNQNNLNVLTASKISVDGLNVKTENGTQFEPVNYRSNEYDPALWLETPACNYSSRNGTEVSAVTVHTIQGTYAGAISWAQNCDANVSYHYVIRSNDGQVTQMVLEADMGWHVGSENPYTIGIEHEGYVDDASWYTDAMYVSSANLSKDITQSGYGISPLRTYHSEPTVDMNVIGGCTKIKGHQHYPNQTHTDPGINWNWEYYYQLINDDISSTLYSTTSGNIYDSGGASANYTNDELLFYLIQPENIYDITLTVNSFEIENNWDYMLIYDGATRNDPLIGEYTGITIPSSITSSGGSLLIEFRSDCATTKPGWDFSYTCREIDMIDPTTNILSDNSWRTDDFQTQFEDNDNVAVEDSFYLVCDFNGSNWYANGDHGFLRDNFNELVSNWTNDNGLWNISNGALYQGDETNSNSNLYQALNQNDNDQFLYHWQGQINGTGSNRRAGIHFMCSTPETTQRGNSYLVYWRVDQDKCQIYKVENDAITLMTDDDVVVDPNTWYDFKISFDKNTGYIKAYLNDSLCSQWVDSAPHQSGGSISLRTGNCEGVYDNMKVYQSRTNEEIITIGTSGAVRFQNDSPSNPSAEIFSINIDTTNNWSAPDSIYENIDWTAPESILTINDGNSLDVDTIYNNENVSANWNASEDQHSGIDTYWYCIGSSLEGSDIVSWTNNGSNLDFTITPTQQMEIGTLYYISIKVKNGAGLFSDVFTSDGFIYTLPPVNPTANFATTDTVLCIGEEITIANNSLNATTYLWSASLGEIQDINASDVTIQYDSSGEEVLNLIASNDDGSDTLELIFNVEVKDSALSEFTLVNDSIMIGEELELLNTSLNAQSYFWNFGNGLTSLDTTPVIQYSEMGEYMVTLIAESEYCTNDTSYQSVWVEATVGLFGKENIVSIYPNPTSDFIIVEAVEIKIIHIYDNTGRLVYSENESSLDGSNRINVESLASGEYHVLVITEKSTLNQSFVIKR